MSVVQRNEIDSLALARRTQKCDSAKTEDKQDNKTYDDAHTRRALIYSIKLPFKSRILPFSFLFGISMADGRGGIDNFRYRDKIKK